jgi:type IV pilus assembly protein PilF
MFRFVPILLALGLMAGCATDPNAPRVNIDDAVTTRVAAGLQYLQQRNPSEARRHFSRALALNPDSPEAHNAMALLYSYERDQEKEEEHYRKALKADGDYSPALNNYGTLLYTKGRYKEALEKFKRAANDANYEARGSAFSNMGQCYQALDEPGKAKAAFIKALRLNPRSVTASLELARLYLAEDNYRQGWDYYQQYSGRIGRPSADGLWVGIRLAAALGRNNEQSSYELALQNLYRNSREHRLWQEWRSGQEAR